MNFPAIYSLGVGYSNSKLDLPLIQTSGVLKKRKVSKNMDGLQRCRKGFGWRICNISLGAQYRIKKNTSKSRLHLQYQLIKPISIFSASATAVIQNAYQFGFDMKFLKTHFKCSISQCSK
jgi:long-chain fatty acid transport protein